MKVVKAIVTVENGYVGCDDVLELSSEFEDDATIEEIESYFWQYGREEAESKIEVSVEIVDHFEDEEDDEEDEE